MTKLLDIEGVAKMLKVKPRTIKAWVNANKIPYQKIVGSIRFDPEKIKRWIHEQSKGEV